MWKEVGVATLWCRLFVGNRRLNNARLNLPNTYRYIICKTVSLGCFRELARAVRSVVPSLANCQLDYAAVRM